MRMSQWGDKSNATLVGKIRVLQNRAAKTILDRPKHSSAAEALLKLGWDTMATSRRFHRLILVYEGLNGLIDLNFNFNLFKAFVTFLGPTTIYISSG